MGRLGPHAIESRAHRTRTYKVEPLAALHPVGAVGGVALRAGVGEGLEPTGERLHLQKGRGGGVVRWWGGGVVGWSCVEGVETCGKMKVGKCGQVWRCREAQGSVQGAEVQRCMQRCSGMRTLESCASCCAELALSCFSRRRTWSTVRLRLGPGLGLGLGLGPGLGFLGSSIRAKRRLCLTAKPKPNPNPNPNPNPSPNLHERKETIELHQTEDAQHPHHPDDAEDLGRLARVRARAMVRG